MKKAISLIGIYFLLLIFGTIIMSTIYMLGSDLMTVVSGQNINFFSVPFFMAGVQTSFPMVCIVSGLLIILYLIRHPGNQILSAVIYAALTVLTWGILIPIDLAAINNSDFSVTDYRKTISSTGVFRSERAGVYFLSKITDDGYADGAFIDVNGFSSQEGKIVNFEKLKINNDDAFPYSDILIKNSIEPPKFVTFPLSVYASLLSVGVNSWAKGLGEWLCFATLAFALIATYGVQFVSSWKLTNAISVIMAELALIFLNYAYYYGYFPQALKDFSVYISKFIPASHPLIVFINILIGGLLILYGIVMGIYRTNSQYAERESL